MTSVNWSSYINDPNGNTLTFDYGSDGLRRSETLTSGGQSVTTYYVYDGQSLVMEETRNAQGVLTPSASYLNGPRGPEYKKDETTGLVKWYLYDGLGSVVGEVDPSGNVTYSAKYDVYGGVRGMSGTATSAQGFVGGCGHLSEAATGLIYMKARYYDPSTGRFVSEDPKGSGNNWYWYADDNPVNNVDATGQSTISFLQALADIGWYYSGMAFAYYACMVAANGTVPGFVAARARAAAVATAAASIAVFCFGQALTGIDGNAEYYANLASNIAAMSGSIYALMMNESATGGAANTIAGVAITASIVEGCMVLGAISSVGIEDE